MSNWLSELDEECQQSTFESYKHDLWLENEMVWEKENLSILDSAGSAIYSQCEEGSSVDTTLQDMERNLDDTQTHLSNSDKIMMDNAVEITTQDRKGKNCLVESNQNLIAVDLTVDARQPNEVSILGTTCDAESETDSEFSSLSLTETLSIQSHNGIPAVEVQGFKSRARDQFEQEKDNICMDMMGTLKTKEIQGLDELLAHIIYIHRRCQQGKSPFHVHRECISTEVATAMDCCWATQFGSIFLNDTKIMRSFQQMCTKTINTACSKRQPKKYIVSFPVFAIQACEEWVKSRLSDPQPTSSFKAKNVKELAESVGLTLKQVHNKVREIRRKINDCL